MADENTPAGTERGRYGTMRAVRALDRVKAYAGTLAFNPFMWGFGASLGVMLLSEPRLMEENLLPAAAAVATFGVRGMTQYRRLEDELSDRQEWSTDLFRKHRRWLLYSWADANGQVPEYWRWRNLYEFESRWTSTDDDGF